MTRLDHYRNQWSLIQASPKFEVMPDGSTTPKTFPGYTLMTPPGAEDGHNREFFTKLAEIQAQLWDPDQGLPAKLAVPLPLDTFHLTIADLIWAGNYEQQVKSIPNYDARLQAEIRNIFLERSGMPQHPISMRVLGFIVMTRALAVCLAPNTETDYQVLLDLRRRIYQSQGLLGLGIDQQYHFTGHLTLGYFTHGESDRVDPEALSLYLNTLNESFLGDFPEFKVHTVELRKFENMLSFQREPDWPVWSFNPG